MQLKKNNKEQKQLFNTTAAYGGSAARRRVLKTRQAWSANLAKDSIFRVFVHVLSLRIPAGECNVAVRERAHFFIDSKWDLLGAVYGN